MSARCTGRVGPLSFLWIAALGAVGCGSDPFASSDLVAVYDEMAARRPWLDFDASSIPLALFDDERTYLVRHPNPPAGFEPVRGRDDLWAMEGRHPSMRANTAIELGEVRTATIRMNSALTVDPRAAARLLIHEAFHAYQDERHPEWSANEVDLFTYPVTSALLLHMRRLETAALRRALLDPDSAQTVCWVRGTLRLRSERFRQLPAEAVAYERGTELREGLARYVEARAAEDRAAPSVPRDGYAPGDVRERAYEVGHGLAHLLDRTDPGWRDKLHADSTASLDGLLAEAVPDTQGRVCELSPDESGRTETVAREDIARYQAENESLRDGFEERAGWRVVIEADRRSPLFPSNFDPLNVRVLGEGVVLHERWLKLEKEGASIEILDRRALTRAAGDHPLFNGVRSLLLTGMRERPEVTRAGDTLQLAAPGVEGRFVGARLEEEAEERALRITLDRG